MPFTPLLYLAAIARTLNKSGNGGHSCLVPGLRGGFQLFSVEHDIGCRFVLHGLYHVSVYSLCAHFVESFYHKKMLNFVKRFLCIY